MSSDNRVTDLGAYRQSLTGEKPSGLKSGGGGGTFDPMEARVAILERTVEKLEPKVDKLVTDMATLTERVSHLPSKEFIYKAVAGIIAAMVGITALAPKIQSWAGNPPAATTVQPPAPPPAAR